MSKIHELLEAETKAAEEAETFSDPSEPLPAHVKITRGHPRAKMLQIRLRDDEYAELGAYAQDRNLPVSTVARVLLLQALGPEDDLKSALDRLERGISAVRRKVQTA